MKKVLVTGASGFIGNYVVRELIRNGYSVIACSAHNRPAIDEQLSGEKLIYIPFDLSTMDAGANYYEYFQRPDNVIHLAWEGLPNYKSSDHVEIYLPRHQRFLENLVRNGLTDLTVTGTCFEYGMQTGALLENLNPSPDNAYGIAKNELRKFTEQLQDRFPLTLKWPRLFYLYGKGQNRNSLLSQLEDALSKGAPEFKMSGGMQVRDYLPVSIAANYLVKIAVQSKVTGVINCCSGNPVTVLSFVEKYLKDTGRSIPLHLGFYPYPDYEPFEFWGDVNKLKSILGDERSDRGI